MPNQQSKRVKEDFPPLIRPIILVCNDGFARALAPMKDICLRIRVFASSRNRIHERIDEILKNERIRTNLLNIKLDTAVE